MILHVLRDDTLDQVIGRPCLVALYWFGGDRTSHDLSLVRTVSGVATLNDISTYISHENLPFGGGGNSG